MKYSLNIYIKFFYIPLHFQNILAYFELFPIFLVFFFININKILFFSVKILENLIAGS